MADTTGPRKPDVAVLPDFCSVASVFTLVVVAELVVVIDALAPDARMQWRGFATATLLVVWLALLASLLLCRLKPLLIRWPRTLAWPLAWGALVVLVALASAVVAWLDHALGTALTPASSTRFVIGNTVLAALLGALLLRARGVARAAGRGGARAIRGAAGAHPSALPVQQHEHGRGAGAGRSGCGRTHGRGFVRTVPRLAGCQ
jgi:hypothetical protein